MKAKLAYILFLLPLTSFSAEKNPIPDVLPDAPSSAYRKLHSLNLETVTGGDGLDQSVSLGERNLLWLEHINSFRPANDKLSLTSKETQRGIPIDKPNEYNPTLIQEKLAKLRAELPKELVEVIFEGRPFTDTPPIALADYLRFSLELDRVFQSALRWRMMGSWLPYLEGRRHNDLRGWWFLSRMENRAEKLRGYNSLPNEEKAQIREWFVGLCFNNDRVNSIRDCQRTVDNMIAKGQDLEAYYLANQSLSRSIFERYFAIPQGVARREVNWNEAAQKVIAPFQDPGTAEVRSFMAVNIEDEWRFGNWKLELPFASSSELPRVEFLPGVTPHVNGLGGNVITMNSQQPLTEYDAQWTIRHEYGHVLGFPDCYVEFYVAERNTIMNYQFDIENLMCSRRGHIQEKHVSELKRAYNR